MNPNAVVLNNVSKRFGAETVVRGIDLAINKGDFVALLGPSGCGKTTTLRMIAGLETATGGEIHINGHRVNDVPVHRRNIGMVFQNHALFPHKTAFQNVAYGLKTRKVSTVDIDRRVRQALEVVRLPTMQDRLPQEMSGGQQQRVAIARAIVINPDLLLLDEPLSALDANLREEMRGELKRIQQTLGVTTLFVTHDQSEALSLADKVVLMNQGRIEQAGTPEELYEHPVTPFAARFFGHVNFLQAQVTGLHSGNTFVTIGASAPILVQGVHREGTSLNLWFRAEKARVVKAGEATPARGSISGVIVGVEYLGMLVKYSVDVDMTPISVVQVIDAPIIPIGEKVQICVPTQAWMLSKG